MVVVVVLLLKIILMIHKYMVNRGFICLIFVFVLFFPDKLSVGLALLLAYNSLNYLCCEGVVNF